MSLLPIATPRTADILTQLRLVRQLNSDNQTLEGLYTQLSTGRRVNTLSDDPASAISAISLQASKEYSNQMLRNADSAEGYLNVTDTTSSNIQDALNESQGTIILAAQTPLSDAERGAYADELERIIERIVTASNANYRGHYVLGGAIDQSAPLTRDGAAIVWSGEPALQSTRISRDWLLETGIQAQQALGVGGAIGTSNDLDVAVTAETSLSEIYGGQGVTPGVIRMGAGQDRIDVDMRAAKTIGDLKDAFEELNFDGRSLQVTISPEGFSINFADGLPGTLSIDDVGEGKMAEQLGIRNPLGFTALPLTTHRLDPTLTRSVKLADLAGGAGLDLSTGFKITQGDATFTVDLSQAETIEDVVVAINLSGADVRARLSPSTGQLQIAGLASGVDYSISENGGDAAQLLGIRSATASTSLTELNRGLGIDTTTGTDFTITRTDGSTLEIDVDGAETIADVLDRINNHIDNVGPTAVTAALRSDANGIELASAVGASALSVSQPNGSNVAVSLGIIPVGLTEVQATDDGTTATLLGRDYRPLETGSAIDTLMRIQAAIEAGDIPSITRLAANMDAHLEQSVIMRADVGSRVQNLQTVRQQTEEFSIELDSQLSNQLDADFAEVITEMTARQQALQASLQVTAQISQLTVLSFL